MAVDEIPQSVRRGRPAMNRNVDDSPVSSPMTKTENFDKKSNKKKIIFIAIGIIILIIIGIAIYSSYELSKIKSQMSKASDPEYQRLEIEKQTKTIVDQVSKIMELPEGSPQIATVSDVDVLKKSQVFFEKAQNGDQVLIYKSQAILYRPSTKKIINVAPVNRDESKSTINDTKPQSQIEPINTKPIVTEPVSTSTKPIVKPAIKK